MAYSWQSDIIRPDGENGTEVLDGQGVYQPQIEGGENITIENGKINASGTLENVQADWSETDPNDPSYIEHKPDLSIYATASGMETELAGKQDIISDLETIRSGAASGSTAVQPGDLAAVATTGSYTSLSNTPQNIVQDTNYVHTDNNFSNADKGKLDGIAAGAEVNVQSDWLEADPSSDAYIANKPTIPDAQQNADWNASSGVTAILNKPDLSAYATDSELTNGLATKQNIISDLDTIRAGAAAGATAAQPSDLPSSDELLPSATSGDAGKILSVDSNGDPEWITPSGGTTYSAGDGVSIDANNVISADVDGVTIGIDSTTKKIKSLQTIPTKTSDLTNDSNFVVASSLATVATSGSYADLSNKPTIPSVDQTYNASSTNAQSGVAVAHAIAAIPAPSVDEVPDVTSSDDGKVLTAAYSGGTGSYSWQPASGGGSSYTAGNGIDITNDEISVDYDSNTLQGLASTTTVSVSQVDEYSGFSLPEDLQQMQTQSSTVNVTIHIPANTFKFESSLEGETFVFTLCRGLTSRGANPYLNAPLSYTETSSTEYWINEQDIVITMPTLQTNGWKYDTNLSAKENFNIVTSDSLFFLTTISNDGVLASPITFTYSGGSHEVLTVKNPLPASAQADSGKVLKVNASGNAEWGTASGTTYTAGNMIAIDANNNNAIGVSTTAGITDIQQVAALPANPVATVLYLIPET